jgi:hypothetical protein
MYNDNDFKRNINNENKLRYGVSKNCLSHNFNIRSIVKIILKLNVSLRQSFTFHSVNDILKKILLSKGEFSNLMTFRESKESELKII